MTPNIGQGANTAIEDVAVLASLINRLVNVDSTQKPSETHIEIMLQEYKRLRYGSVKSTCERAKFGARFHTRDDWLKTLVGRYVFPHAISLTETRIAKILARGDIIDFLPPPERTRSRNFTRSSKDMEHPRGLWVLLWISSLVLCLFLLWIRHYLLPDFW